MPNKKPKVEFEFKKIKRPPPEGVLQETAREFEDEAKEKKANKGKKTKNKKNMKAGGALKAPANPGLKKLPTKVRNKMGYMKSGGKVTSKCKRDGIAIRGRTKGRMV